MDAMELQSGNRKAVISPLGAGRFSVWVGYVLPCGSHVGALWFDGLAPSASYNSHGRAVRAAEEFVHKRKGQP